MGNICHQKTRVKRLYLFMIRKCILMTVAASLMSYLKPVLILICGLDRKPVPHKSLMVQYKADGMTSTTRNRYP